MDTVLTQVFKKKENNGGGKKASSLSVRIFTCFVLFALLVIIILWLFQVVFLDDIYRMVKLHDMKNCAEDVCESVEDGNVEEAVVAASKKYNSCIRVYAVSGSSGHTVSSAHINTTCMIHNIDSNELINDIYLNAKKEEYYIKRLDMKVNGGDRLMAPDSAEGTNPTSVICAKIITAGNTDYMTVVDSEIAPLTATTRTLTYQLIVITVILLASSAVISLVISKKLSKPIEKMTKEASLLATGKYDVNFDTDGFKEAKQLGETLNYAAGELSKLDTMQKELIANISHDLRTPLTMIRGYGEVMKDIPGEMTAENMQVIIDETTRLSSLVSDMLELSKLTEKGEIVKKEIFSLTDTVDETANRYRHLTEKDGYTVVFEANSSICVCADKTRILQVIYNLINNAINYTGEDKTVRIVQSVIGDKVRISVTDSGEGIPEEQLPMIWERYYKVGGFHNRGKVGTGLGLSIVKKILVMHNADFGVSSTPGVGSTFWFELPAVSCKTNAEHTDTQEGKQ